MPIGKSFVVGCSRVEAFRFERGGILLCKFLIAYNNRGTDAALTARVIDVLPDIAFRFFGEFGEKRLLEPPCMSQDITQF